MQRAMRIYCFLLGISFIFACQSLKLRKPKSGFVGPKNVQILDGDLATPFGPCEPSISVDPTNPNRLLAGSILNRLHTSEDGGKTWNSSLLKSEFGVYGDPVTHIDAKGNYYYAHLSDPDQKGWASTRLLDRIVVQKSTDQGKTFASTFTGLAHPKDQDKHWISSDPKSGLLFCTWTEFDLYGSKDRENKSRILFSSKAGDDQEWTKPLKISELEGDCIDDDETTEGAVPCPGPNGEIYVSWAFDQNIWFDKSFDAGKTWLKQDKLVARQPEGWAISIPGIGRCNGMPITACDISQSKHRGTIYVNWADQRNGKDDTDIWLSKSTDQGKNWSEPMRVNNDASKNHQFFTWMTIDQISGHIYIVFYDRRAYTTTETDVYLAVSTDGGAHFENHKISETPFIPTDDVFFGDYNCISAHAGVVRPIWTRLDQGKLSVWTALLQFPPR
jgi:hypothetical protein